MARSLSAATSNESADARLCHPPWATVRLVTLAAPAFVVAQTPSSCRTKYRSSLSPPAWSTPWKPMMYRPCGVLCGCSQVGSWVTSLIVFTYTPPSLEWSLATPPENTTSPTSACAPVLEAFQVAASPPRWSTAGLADGARDASGGDVDGTRNRFVSPNHTSNASPVRSLIVTNGIRPCGAASIPRGAQCAPSSSDSYSTLSAPAANRT